MRKLAILHFSPIELYPPVLNWLNFLAAQDDAGLEVRVFTMASAGAWRYEPGTDSIRIIRAGSAGSKGPWARWNYLVYYWGAFRRLCAWRPDAVLYYETLSALPAYLYGRWSAHRFDLFIHYHEYTSPAEYLHGMRLGRRLHRLEKKMYGRAKWISHTNPDRVRLFSQDLAWDGDLPFRVLPNYPPASWRSAASPRERIDYPVRLVYVGALSLDTMYTRELAEWVMSQSGKVTWDIYSDNFTREARAYLESLGGKWIRFNKGMEYFSLPAVLAGYNIGVILYKGHIPNYVYNAPNKLFEYMACGLDVWFPQVMVGCLPYRTNGAWPRVMALDFERLSGLDLEAAIDRSGLRYAPGEHYAGHVLPELLNALRS